MSVCTRSRSESLKLRARMALGLWALTSFLSLVHADQPPFAWPHGAKAAVSLAYDDALASQLDIAIPALNKVGLKGTFYLILSSEIVRTRMPEWRAAAVKGHELGNHTLFHQCSRSAPDRSWVTPDNDLDKTSAAQMAAQIRLGNSMLNVIDGKDKRTFTTPCGEVLAAGENYLTAIRSDFVAMKSAFGGVAATMRPFDPYAVSVAVPTDVTGAQLIAIVQQAASTGTMANITFHGVGGDYLSVSKEAHAELLAYLAKHRDIYWTDTFINIMQYVIARNATPLGK